MEKEKSLYDVVAKQLSGIRELSEYSHIFEEDIIRTYPFLFSLPQNGDYIFKIAKDYFFFAVLPSVEIINREKLKKTHKKPLLQLQTLLAVDGRFSNNLVDKHSNCQVQNDLTFHAYTLYESIQLINNELREVVKISPIELFQKNRENIELASHKIFFNESEFPDQQLTIRESARFLWKRVADLLIVPSCIGTTQNREIALKNYLSANILIDDLLDLFDDYKCNRATLPLLLWKSRSREMLVNKWQLDFVIKETLNIIFTLLDEAYELFKDDKLEYPLQIINVQKDIYREWFL